MNFKPFQGIHSLLANLKFQSPSCGALNSCNLGSGPTLGYGYDLAGGLAQFSNSLGAWNTPMTLSVSYDAGGHFSTMNSDFAAYAQNLFTMQDYGAVGPLTWQLGSNLTINQTYTNRLWTNSITTTGEIQ